MSASDSLPYRLRSVATDEIDAEDRELAISLRRSAPQSLLDSVARVGLLTPLRVLRKPDSSYLLIHGFRRLEAAIELGLPRVPVWEAAPGDPKKGLFLESLEENLCSRPLTTSEKALALSKLKGQCGVPVPQLISEFLPRLGVKGDNLHLERFLRLAEAGDRLLGEVDALLDLEVALLLSRRSAEDQEFYCGLFQRLGLGRNKQKELLALLEEVRALQPPARRSLPGFWSEIGGEDLEASTSLSPADKWKGIFLLLRRLRYPRLSGHERRFEQLCRALRLPAGVRLEPPPQFEGNQLSVSFSFAEPSQLKRIAVRLSEIADEAKIRQLLDLL